MRWPFVLALSGIAGLADPARADVREASGSSDRESAHPDPAAGPLLAGVGAPGWSEADVTALGHRDASRTELAADARGRGDGEPAAREEAPSGRRGGGNAGGASGGEHDEPDRADGEVALEDEGVADRDLGAFEEEALEQALEARSLEVVADPEGKVVRDIRVVNLDAFGDHLRFLDWLNNLRRTTREDVVAREVLVRPGEEWDGESIAETRRNLKDPSQSSLVVIRPVRPEHGGGESGSGENPGDDARGDDEVDVLVVTRDVWSLRVQGNFEAQEDVLSSLSAAVVETNFLGRRKFAAFELDLDLGAFAMGPTYIDPNIAGSRVELAARAAAVFSRDTGDLEGTRSQFNLAYPLWSLDREWGASLTLRHDDSIERSFEGGEIRRYDAPDTPEDDGLPWEYDRRELEVQTEAVRSFPGELIQRVAIGHELELERPEVLAGFPGDDVQREAFERDVLPRSERASALYARYRLFEPRYVMYRDLDTFDLREERRLGPDFRFRLSVAGRALGSEAGFLRARGGLAWGERLGGDGLASASVEADARLQGGELIDNEVLAALVVASPRVRDLVRVVARADAAAKLRETSNRFYTLGGLSGLRGYDLGEFAGTRRVRANVEARSAGFSLWLLRAGAIAFWDLGHAADRARDLAPRHDVGLGLRFLVPQFSRFVFRVDWAVPLHGAEAGFPGRITAGGGQAF